MLRRAASPAIVRKRGNPNFGKPMLSVPALPTEFEMQAMHLGLTPETYFYSPELRSWCERNKNRFYVPERLLAEWGIAVDPNVTDAA